MSDKKRNIPLLAGVAVLVIAAATGAAFMTGAIKFGDKAQETAAPAAADSSAVTETTADNPVVARVNGREIHRSDVLEFVKALPPGMQTLPIEQIYPIAIDQLVALNVIEAKAWEANFEDDPEVLKRVAEAKRDIVRNTFLKRAVDAKLTDEAVQQAYADYTATVKPAEEIHARHILVDSEQKAKDLITQLDNGADFVKLVEQNATGPGSENGGDLGFFTKEEMVPAFAEAAFTIAPGQYSKTPVQTQFGWHVIKVEEKRTRPVPTLEEVRPQIESELRQAAVQGVIDEWRAQAKVETFDINGNPVAPAPAASAPEGTDPAIAPADAAMPEGAVVDETATPDMTPAAPVVTEDPAADAQPAPSNP